MLRSTGFFRGIDCPFYSDHGEGRSGRTGCSRPYCHFRHSRDIRLSHGAADAKRNKEQGYDPFKPKVVHAELQNEPGATSGDINGALALVNRAIEEVRGQMEREKRKLSRIGDEPYDPSEKASQEIIKPKAAAAQLAYDPGNYQMTSADYHPSPGCSKYTLDTKAQENTANSTEYVPTVMKKSTAGPRKLSPSPSSVKYSSSTNSAKSKYTLDNSKPSTDMEYDPMSNYSASITGKRKKEASGKPNRKSPRMPCPTEEYVVTVKKQTADAKRYTMSDSDGESSGLEYKPTSISSLQLKKSCNATDVDGANGRLEKVRTEYVENALSQRNKLELIDLTLSDNDKLKSSPNKKKLDSGKAEKKTLKEASKPVASSKRSSELEKSKVLKVSNHSTSKKENKGQMEVEKSRDKIKTSKVASDLKAKSSDITKSNASKKRRADSESGGSESKKVKPADKGKNKHNKNGKLESSKSLKNVWTDEISSCSSIKSTDKTKNSPRSSKKPAQKERSLSITHADLFGDESPEEAEPFQAAICDDLEEESVVRKCAETLKRRLNKRKASEMSPQSSDEDSDRDETAELEVESLGVDLSGFQDDLDFESDPLEECLRIFNESNDVKREDKGRKAKQAVRDSDEDNGTDSTSNPLFPGQKKRVSHFVAKGNVEAPPKAVVRPYKRLTAQEACYQRLQLAQQQAAQLRAQSQGPGASGEKRRVAHRPNPNPTTIHIGVAKSKTKPSRVSSPSQSPASVKSQTTAGILSKTTSTSKQRRVAHTPTLKSTSMKRPVIPIDFGAKVPTNVRQRYLNTFIDECIKFCASDEAAFQMALDEESVVYERSSSKNIYLNIAVNTLKKLRSRGNPSSSPASKPAAAVSNRRAQSHEEVLGGRLAATTSFTVNRTGKQSQEKLSGATLYHKLKPYLMSEEQLQEHGYPRKDPEASGRALLCNVEKKAAPVDPFSKVCCRCGAEYKVNTSGSCVRKEECTFHWGRLRRHKVSGGWETSYSCCSGAVGALGCQTSKQHVQDGRKESFEGFVSTFSKSLPADGNAGVFALDCEMCYTKQGLELTRVTVIDSQFQVIYDTFVKPASKVVDYNTRFSGVTEEDLRDVSITLRDVQAVLLSMFSAESILLGHSLESDLMALKLIHSSVVDTAIVFPHRLGLPYKRALRNLMADHLKRIIQDSVGGHDSSEDASACMELMIWKIKEDAKVKR
ncbi:unnamed protein product [Knipowitschia caucasica]